MSLRFDKPAAPVVKTEEQLYNEAREALKYLFSAIEKKEIRFFVDAYKGLVPYVLEAFSHFQGSSLSTKITLKKDKRSSDIEVIWKIPHKTLGGMRKDDVVQMESLLAEEDLISILEWTKIPIVPDTTTVYIRYTPKMIAGKMKPDMEVVTPLYSIKFNPEEKGDEAIPLRFNKEHMKEEEEEKILAYMVDNTLQTDKKIYLEKDKLWTFAKINDIKYEIHLDRPEKYLLDRYPDAETLDPEEDPELKKP